MTSQLEQVFTADKQSILESETMRTLGTLVQPSQYVGDVYSISYESALVLIHDNHRQRVGGIPSLSFLIATRIQPDTLLDPIAEDTSIILLRVMDAAALPNAPEAERVRVQVAQNVSGVPNQHWDEQEAMDPLTGYQLSFAGVSCRVIGTFYLEMKKEIAGHGPKMVLRFGSDLANYYPNRGLKVFKPNREALQRIVNFRDPERLDSKTDATVDIGEVRYASTHRLHQGVSGVPVSIMPNDLLGQKTALFGMTRTGKSNTTKIIMKAVFDLRYERGERHRRIGQLVFDANGEYANENTQDRDSKLVPSAIKNLREARPDAKPDDVITYGITEHVDDPGRKLMLLNFYLDSNLQIGKDIINDNLADISTIFVDAFRQVRFVKPAATERSALTRYNRHVLCYRALLNKAGFKPPAGVKPEASNLFNKDLRKAMRDSKSPAAAAYVNAADLLESSDLTWDQVGQVCAVVYDFIREKTSGFREFESEYIKGKKRRTSGEKEASPSSDSNGVDETDDAPGGDSWADAQLLRILDMFRQPNGVNHVNRASRYHTPLRSGDFAEEIYKDLKNGKLVIVDQSSGDDKTNRASAERIMQYIFEQNRKAFRSAQEPPDMLIYVEEAHTLLPPDSEKKFDDIWVRTAKEGGKYHLGLVYATQEVSSIQRNIIKNTANFLVAHLNNTDETRELCKYYDFLDFEPSIRRAQDTGFLRVKTLSNRFIVPVQIKPFHI